MKDPDKSGNNTRRTRSSHKAKNEGAGSVDNCSRKAATSANPVAFHPRRSNKQKGMLKFGEVAPITRRAARRWGNADVADY